MTQAQNAASPAELIREAHLYNLKKDVKVDDLFGPLFSGRSLSSCQPHVYTGGTEFMRLWALLLAWTTLEADTKGQTLVCLQAYSTLDFSGET